MVVEETDEALMQAYQAGSSEAFEELYARYSGRVYSYLRKRIHEPEAVEEVFQGIFLKLHRSRRLYDPKYRFAPWLFTICRRFIIDAARTKQIYQAASPRVDDLVLAAEAPIEAADLPVDALSAEEQNVLKLRYEKDMSFREMAERLELSEAAVRKRVSRAIKALRTLIRKDAG